jgi:hypothetical protein
MFIYTIFTYKLYTFSYILALNLLYSRSKFKIELLFTLFSSLNDVDRNRSDSGRNVGYTKQLSKVTVESTLNSCQTAIKYKTAFKLLC